MSATKQQHGINKTAFKQLEMALFGCSDSIDLITFGCNME